MRHLNSSCRNMTWAVLAVLPLSGCLQLGAPRSNVAPAAPQYQQVDPVEAGPSLASVAGSAYPDSDGRVPVRLFLYLLGTPSSCGSYSKFALLNSSVGEANIDADPCNPTSNPVTVPLSDVRTSSGSLRLSSYEDEIYESFIQAPTPPALDAVAPAELWCANASFEVAVRSRLDGSQRKAAVAWPPQTAFEFNAGREVPGFDVTRTALALSTRYEAPGFVLEVSNVAVASAPRQFNASLRVKLDGTFHSQQVTCIKRD